MDGLDDEKYFHSGDDDKDKVTMLDMAIDIIELWDVSGSPYNQHLKRCWLKRAKDFGIEPLM